MVMPVEDSVCPKICFALLCFLHFPHAGETALDPPGSGSGSGISQSTLPAAVSVAVLISLQLPDFQKQK